MNKRFINSGPGLVLHIWTAMSRKQSRSRADCSQRKISLIKSASFVDEPKILLRATASVEQLGKC